MKKKHLNENEIEELKNQLARALADYDNLLKRTQQAEGEIVKYASLRLVIKLLPVLDMLYEAQKHIGDSGLAIALSEFEGVLAEENIRRMDVEKDSIFNEELHEVVETKEGKAKDKGKIESVVLTGWKYENGPVIRHAKVVVFK